MQFAISLDMLLHELLRLAARFLPHIGCHGGESSVGDFKISLLGLAVLLFVMDRHNFFIITVNLSNERIQSFQRFPYNVIKYIF